MTDPLPDGCWADPLTREERAELARMLARWTLRFHGAARMIVRGQRVERAAAEARNLAGADCADLYTDVTERAAVPSHA